MKPLKWISSTGGPLIIMGKESSTVWLGDAIGSQEETKTHYQLACDIEGLWGLLKVEGNTAIVLADEPSLTTWIPDKDNLGGIIVRWIYADSEEEVLKHLTSIPKSAWNNEGEINIDSEELYVFDSVEPLQEAMEENVLSVSLKKGIYELFTQEFKPDENTHLRLLQFKRTML